LLHACAGTLTALHLAQAPPADVVRDRLDAYLRVYEGEVTALIATELMTQSLDAHFNQTLRIPEPGRTRKFESEVAFVGLPGDAGLLGFRRVLRLDGKAIDPPGPSMTDLLQTLASTDVAQRLLDSSARHNLGTARNTNLPTLPLELLHPQHRGRFAHALKGTDRVRGVSAAVIVAREIRSPSIVRSPQGADLLSHVVAWVDDRGRLLRAEVQAEPAAFASPRERPRLRVEFIQHNQLGILVPSEMREDFWSQEEMTPGKTVARYSNYRRFQTSARILPPQP
jgi:hypothetical protein